MTRKVSDKSTFEPEPRENAFLREAIRLAMENVGSGRGGPFGAVVVRDATIVGRGTNLVTSTNDPTAHAEVVAIRQACSAASSFSLEDCEIYSSCQPCPMCLAAIFWARLSRIHFAATCQDAAAAGFDDRLFYDELAKEPDSRLIPMHQSLRDEALPVFAAWRKSADRVQY